MEVGAEQQQQGQQQDPNSGLGAWDVPRFANSTQRLDVPSSYMLSKARTKGDPSQLNQCMKSNTVYVGHLALSTSEEQLLEVFSSVGTPRRIIMGLNAHTQAPTGFCFVEFKSRGGALNAVKYLNKTKINGRQIDVDLDPGFVEGRQFGRGDNGAQRGSQFRQRGGFSSSSSSYRGGRARNGRFRDRDRFRNNNNNNNNNNRYRNQYQDQYQGQNQYQ